MSLKPPPRPPTHCLRVASSVVLTCCMALVAIAPAYAQWKWRDASGRIQFSDLPPPNQVPDKDILQRPGPPQAPKAAAPVSPTAPAASGAAPASNKPQAALPKTAADTELEQRRKAEDQDRKARRLAEDERLAGQRRDNCQRAREAVATLESGQRIARMTPKGEREVMNDEQRATETQRAKAVVASDCR